jgi:hypothetical protein
MKTYTKCCSIHHRMQSFISRRRWEDIIKTDVQEIGFGNVHWTDPGQHRDMWRALANNSDDTSGHINCRKFLEQNSAAYHVVR